MEKDHPLYFALRQLTNDLRLFIELSLQETDASWEEWLSLVLKEGEIRCWERKQCGKKDCPAYLNPDRRCWLVAGTFCGGKVQGEFAVKYKNCTECDVYQDAVFKDPVTEIYEHIITLVHSLKATQDRLKSMAIRDPLTGIYNRNFFNAVVSNEIERTRRYGDRFSIVMMDIDDFKQINDTFGHLIGDWVLKECSLILGKSIRASDLLVRFGGDEFLVITPETDFRECDSLVTRVQGNLEHWNQRNAESGCRLSVSIGCAVFEQGNDLLETIQKADRQMYQNKIK